MAKCLDCDTAYCVFGGSKGSKCPNCKSDNIDTSKENQVAYKDMRNKSEFLLNNNTEVCS